ncbi:MAG TPA: N-acetyltransferase, partial [Micromonosporaceae bacterium]|nr:N-acetyltransferase [Micromonosporaceae bacterium]
MTGYVTVRRFPTLTVQTPRLDVRQLTEADADPVAHIFADKQTQRWLPFPQEFGAIEGRSWCTDMAAERRDSGMGDHYGIIRREDQRLGGCLWTRRPDWNSPVT